MVCVILTIQTFSIKKDDVLIKDNKLVFININYTEDYKYSRVYDADFDSNIIIENIMDSEELSKKFLKYGKTGREIYDNLTTKTNYDWVDIKNLPFLYYPYNIEFDYEEI